MIAFVRKQHRLMPLTVELGLTPCAILEKFKAIQMIDVPLPTTDGRNLVLSRYTQPEKDRQLLLYQLNLMLPKQPPPRLEELQKKCGEDL